MPSTLIKETETVVDCRGLVHLGKMAIRNPNLLMGNPKSLYMSLNEILFV